MEANELKKINDALDVVYDIQYYSPRVSARLEGLSDDDKEVLHRDTLSEIRKLAAEVLEQHPDGILDLGELGKYNLSMDDDTVTMLRDRNFTSDEAYELFSTVFDINTTSYGSASSLTGHLGDDKFLYDTLDAQETMRAVHTTVYPHSCNE